MAPALHRGSAVKAAGSSGPETADYAPLVRPTHRPPAALHEYTPGRIEQPPTSRRIGLVAFAIKRFRNARNSRALTVPSWTLRMESARPLTAQSMGGGAERRPDLGPLRLDRARERAVSGSPLESRRQCRRQQRAEPRRPREQPPADQRHRVVAEIGDWPRHGIDQQCNQPPQPTEALQHMRDRP